jgi:hypothetical protein
VLFVSFVVSLSPHKTQKNLYSSFTSFSLLAAMLILVLRAWLFYRRAYVRRTAMKRLPTGDALEKLAHDLGVSFHAAAGASGINEAIIQERVLAALRERRDAKMWILALASAIASALSALAAWCAIVFAR